jgi:hypothetical protein
MLGGDGGASQSLGGGEHVECSSVHVVRSASWAHARILLQDCPVSPPVQKTPKERSEHTRPLFACYYCSIVTTDCTHDYLWLWLV